MSSTDVTSTTQNWRSRMGYLTEGGSDFESIHILLGYFLADHDSPNPLPEQTLLSEDGKLEWGQGPILEKVLNTPADFEFLMQNPTLFRESLFIIEPWEHVGLTAAGTEVRASKNIAYVAQRVADADSVLLPAWSSGVLEPETVAALMSSGLAIVVEGGHPSVQDASTFTHPECSRDDLFALVEEILLARAPNSCPALFICLGHQLACESHLRLLRRAVQAVLDTETLDRDLDGKTLKTLKTVCQHIKEVGDKLEIRKDDGQQVVATDWYHAEFCVAKNEEKEMQSTRLMPYKTPDVDESHVPFDLIQTHDVLADELEGVIDTTLEYEKDVHISMFHSDEVNEEAILFANWAYATLHNAIVPHRVAIAGSPLSWLMQLPYAVEILASTGVDGDVLTEVAATCINYKDFETKRIRRSFTCQFHPELLADLNDFSNRPVPSYAELKADSGIRLLVRLLYSGMQD